MASKKAEEALTQISDLKCIMESMQASMSEVSSAVGAIATLKSSIDTVSLSVNDLGKSLNEKIDGLSKSTADLSKRVEDVNTNLSNDILQVETRLSSEISKIKENIESTRVVVDENKVAVDSKIQALEEELRLVHDRLDGEKKRFVALERSCHAGGQHGRGWNVEFDGIPVNVGDSPEQLEDAILKILFSINVDIEDYEIDRIHRLPSKSSPKPVIARFISRKTVDKVHKNKHKLKDIADLDLDIPGINDQSRIFIRASLSPYYNNLSYNCRVLKRRKMILRIRTNELGRLSIQKIDGSFVKVDHESDLTKIFPDFKEFNFDYDHHSDVTDL